METKIKLLLLVKMNGSITELINDGYSYGQIARMVNECLSDDFLSNGENGLCLSDKGKKFLEKNVSGESEYVGDYWILPEEKSKIVQLKENEVYLPNRNELDF